MKTLCTTKLPCGISLSIRVLHSLNSRTDRPRADVQLVASVPEGFDDPEIFESVSVDNTDPVAYRHALDYIKAGIPIVATEFSRIFGSAPTHRQTLAA